ncbi:hypothetical protein Q7A53_10090 [Halobacillus rhizosphaerae]|uniref:SHOCT-like domain-containing protein n=1 Tax=Halobacillus rhizosphaerae TaxID=3064889 RepID=UPI00398A93C4
MNEEISRILTMVEEGKLDKEKAAELIDLMQDKGGSIQQEKHSSTPYLDKVMKIRAASEGGDDVKVNVPIKLLKAVLGVGMNIAEKVPEAAKYIKDVDVNLLIEAIENELDGQIVDITSATGDKVSVIIE